MRSGTSTEIDPEQNADRKSHNNRLELLVNNAFDVLGLRRDVRELRRVADFCTSVTSFLDPDEVLTAAAKKLHEYFHYSLLIFSLNDQAGTNAVAFYPGCIGDVTEHHKNIISIFPGLKIENIKGYETLGISLPHRREIGGYVDCFELPLDMGFMRIITDGNMSENHSPAFLPRILETLAIAIKNAIEFGRVREDSMRDSLTGLYNRRVLEEMLILEDRKRGVNPLSLLLIDLDNFKAINDTYGHPAGDLALKSAASVLRENTRGSDLVVRNGGEEFAVMLPSASASVALQVGERLRKSIENSLVEYNGIRITLTASLGIAHRPGKEHCPANELIVQADEALYQAKKTGKNRVCFYSSSPVIVRREKTKGQSI
jgi:two-component system cell cycle response regulator